MRTTSSVALQQIVDNRVKLLLEERQELYAQVIARNSELEQALIAERELTLYWQGEHRQSEQRARSMQEFVRRQISYIEPPQASGPHDPEEEP